MSQELNPLVVKLGQEFRVNTYTNSYQNLSSVTQLNNGNFVVTWQSSGQDGSDDGVYGQIFNSQGNKVGSEFRVNTYTNSSQIFPSVTGLDNSNFVITWQSNGQDGSSYGVYGQIFNPQGNKVGSEFRVNTYTNSWQSFPSVTGLENGNFVVTWQSDGQDGSSEGVYGQIFHPQGSKIGSEFRVNTYTNNRQSQPSVTALDNGNFVVTWHSDGQDGSMYGVYGQIFNPQGNKVGSEFRVNTHTNHSQLNPSVTGLDNGNFVVTWASRVNGSVVEIYGQIFNPQGNKVGNEFRVNTYTNSWPNDQNFPSVTGLDNVNFVVTWQSEEQDGSYDGVYGQIFDSQGNKVGNEFQINTYTYGSQSSPSVTSLENDKFVVTWSSRLQYGNSDNVYGQIFYVSFSTLAFSQSDYSINEDGSVVHKVTVNRTGNLSNTVSATLTLSNGTASDEDYYNNPIVVTFNPDETSKVIEISIINDTEVEEDETINLTLSNPTGSAYLGDVTNATLRINDDDRLVVKLGQEFQVNTYTHDSQTRSSVTSLENGNFVITWSSGSPFSSRNGPDGSLYGISGQIFNPEGNKIGNEFQINTYTNDDQALSSITSLENGNFVVTWQSDGQDGSEWGIYGQIFNPEGNKIGNEFQVNTHTNHSQLYPSVTGLDNGNFVVTWQSDGQDGSEWGIYGQIFNPQGNKVGNEFQVNTYTNDRQGGSSITSLENGNFVVTWQSDGQDGSGDGIYGQIFNPEGNKIGNEFQVNTYTDGTQGGSSITSLENGNFVVTWTSQVQNSYDYEIYGQIFNPESNKIGDEFQVNTYTNDRQIGSSVTELKNSYFIVTWISYGQDGSGKGVYGQIFNPEGNKIGNEFQVNTYTDGGQDFSSVTSLENHNFIVTWTSQVQNSYDYEIYGQLFKIHSLLTFSKPNYSIKEDSDIVHTVTINRIGDLNSTVGITVNLSNGTASDADYINDPIIVTFNPGEESKVIEIPIINDTEAEGDETIIMTLSNPTGGAILEGITDAILTIKPNNSIIEIEQDTYNINESEGNLEVTVTRTLNNNEILTVQYETIGNPDISLRETATPDVDYTPILGQITFNSDESSKILTIPIHEDYLVELPESFKLILTNSGGGNYVLGNNEAVIYIVDNDQYSPAISEQLSVLTQAKDDLTYILYIFDLLGNEPSINELKNQYITAFQQQFLAEYENVLKGIYLQQSEINKLITEIELAQQDKDVKEERLQYLLIERDGLTAKIEIWEQQKEQIKNYNLPSQETINNKITEIEGDIADTEQQIAGIRSQLNNSSDETKQKDLNLQLNALKSQLYAHIANLDAHKTLLDLVGLDIKLQLERIDLKINQQTEDLNLLNNEIPTQTDLVNSANTKLSNLETDLNLRETELDEITISFKQFQSRNAYLLTNDASDYANWDINEYSSETAKLRQQLLSLEGIEIIEDRLTSIDSQGMLGNFVEDVINVGTLGGYIDLDAQLWTEISSLSDIWWKNLQQSNKYTTETFDLTLELNLAVDNVTTYIEDNLATPYIEYVSDRIQLSQAIALEEALVEYEDSLAKSVDGLEETIEVLKNQQNQYELVSARLDHVSALTTYDDVNSILPTVQNKLTSTAKSDYEWAKDNLVEFVNNLLGILDQDSQYKTIADGLRVSLNNYQSFTNNNASKYSNLYQEYIDIGNTLTTELDNISSARDAQLDKIMEYGAIRRDETGNYYFLGNAINDWFKARDEGFANGGYLVTINSSAEQNWLNEKFGFTSYWIGLSDAHQEGNWKWVNGDPVTYTNWDVANGEPSNRGGNEDYVRVYPKNGGDGPLGTWNDEGPYSDYSGDKRGLIEVEFGHFDIQEEEAINTAESGLENVVNQLENLHAQGIKILINKTAEVVRPLLIEQLNEEITNKTQDLVIDIDLSNDEVEQSIESGLQNYIQTRQSTVQGSQDVIISSLQNLQVQITYFIQQAEANSSKLQQFLTAYQNSNKSESTVNNLLNQYYPNLFNATTINTLKQQINIELTNSQEEYQTLKGKISEQQAQSSAALSMAEWYEEQAEIHWNLSKKQGPTWTEERKAQGKSGKSKTVIVTHVDHDWIIWNAYSQQAEILREQLANLDNEIDNDTYQQELNENLISQWQQAYSIADEAELTFEQFQTKLEELEAGLEVNPKTIGEFETILTTLEGQLTNAQQKTEDAKTDTINAQNDFDSSNQTYETALIDVLAETSEVEANSYILLQQIANSRAWVTQQMLSLDVEMDENKGLMTKLEGEIDQIKAQNNGDSLSLEDEIKIAQIELNIETLAYKQTVLTAEKTVFTQKQTLLDAQENTILAEKELLIATLVYPDDDHAILERLLNDAQASLAEAQVLAEDAEANSKIISGLLDKLQAFIEVQNDTFLDEIKAKQETLQTLIDTIELKENYTSQALDKQLELNVQKQEIINLLETLNGYNNGLLNSLLDEVQYGNFATVAEIYYRDYRDIVTDTGGSCSGGIARPEDADNAQKYYDEMQKYEQLQQDAQAKADKFTELAQATETQIELLETKQATLQQEYDAILAQIKIAGDNIEQLQKDLNIAEIRLDALEYIKDVTQQVQLQLFNVEQKNLALAQLEQEFAQQYQNEIDDAIRADFERQQAEINRDRAIAVVKIEQLNQLEAEDALQQALNELRERSGLAPIDIIQLAEYKGQLAGLLTDLGNFEQKPDLSPEIKTLLQETMADIADALQGKEAQTIQENLIRTANAFNQEAIKLEAQINELNAEEINLINILTQSETDLQNATKNLYDEIEKARVLGDEYQEVTQEQLDILYAIGYAESAVDLSSPLAQQSKEILDQIIEGRIEERKIREKAAFNEIVGTVVMVLAVVGAIFTGGATLGLYASTSILATVGSSFTLASSVVSAAQAAYNGDWAGAIFNAAMAVVSYQVGNLNSELNEATNALKAAEDAGSTIETINSLKDTITGIQGSLQNIQTFEAVAQSAYGAYRAVESGDNILGLLSVVKGVADVVAIEGLDIGDTLGNSTNFSNLEKGLITAGQLSVTAYQGIEAIEEGNWELATQSISQIAGTIGSNFASELTGDKLGNDLNKLNVVLTAAELSPHILDTIEAIDDGDIVDLVQSLGEISQGIKENFPKSREDSNSGVSNDGSDSDGGNTPDNGEENLSLFDKASNKLDEIIDKFEGYEKDLENYVQENFGLTFEEIEQISKTAQILVDIYEDPSVGNILTNINRILTQWDTELKGLTNENTLFDADNIDDIKKLIETTNLVVDASEDGSWQSWLNNINGVVDLWADDIRPWVYENVYDTDLVKYANELEIHPDNLTIDDQGDIYFTTGDGLSILVGQKDKTTPKAVEIFKETVADVEVIAIPDELERKEEALREIETALGMPENSLIHFDISLASDQETPVLTIVNEDSQVGHLLTDGETFIPIDENGYVTGEIIDEDGAEKTPDDINHVKGFFVGATDAGVEAVEGLWAMGEGLWYITGGWITNPEKAEETVDNIGQTAEAIYDDPTLIWDAMTKPITDRWEEGKYGEAIGRGTVEALGAVFGTKGLDKTAKVAKVGDKITDLNKIPDLDNTTSIKYTPIDQGPLHDILSDIPDPNTGISEIERVVGSFRGGSYTATKLEKPLKVYRVIPDNGSPYGGYWTTTKPTSRLEARMNLAIDTSWYKSPKNIDGLEVTTFDTPYLVYEAEIPAGTTLYHGIAESQLRSLNPTLIDNFVGGGTQIYLPRDTVKSININLEPSHIDPIILDLNGDGIQLTYLPQSLSFFDLDGDGNLEHTSWTNDGIIVVDLNQDGVINSIHEIFSEKYNNLDYNSGLEALATFDSNNDGVINANDNNFSQLKVWQDVNLNALTDSGELLTLSELNITSLNLNGSVVEEINNGNIVQNLSNYTLTDSTTGTLAEVSLLADALDFQANNTDNEDYNLLYINSENIINGTDEIDIAIVTTPQPITLDLGATNIEIVLGHNGNDTFSNSKFEQVLIDGNNGDDTISGGIEDDVLIGGNGDDSINGLFADDYLDGGKGSDRLSGGLGADILTGGENADTFIYNNITESTADNPDTITDFEVGSDIIDISALSLNFSDLTITIEEGKTIITSNTTDFGLLLEGELALTSADFIINTSTPINNPPTINSSNFEIAENQTEIGTIQTTDIDGDTLTYNITGGADSSLFQIEPNTGLLSFINPPDYENPLDSNINNQYIVRITVNDGTVDSDSVLIRVTVTDVVEANEILGTEGRDRLDGTSADDIIYGLGDNDRLQGRGGNDTIEGGDGNDQLYGNAGADVLSGGAGNDRYYIDTKDTIIESSGRNDAIYTSSNADLANYSGIEHITLLGRGDRNATGDDNINKLTGNNGDNILNGKGEKDTIKGKNGNDILIGGEGNDVLAGGSGFDSFQFNATTEGTDRITDFNVLEDRILISGANFSPDLVAGSTITPEQFVYGTSATTTEHLFIYDATQGILRFDADGIGNDSAILIAKLTNTPTNFTDSHILVF